MFDKYMKMYVDEHPDERTPDSAGDFLRRHNDKYRAEVNDTAILSFRNNDFDKAVHEKIFQLIDQDTFRLHEKITAMSQDLKEISSDPVRSEK